MEKVLQVVAEIKDNLTQTSSSQKDEVKVMKAMLNDKEFSVDIYSNKETTKYSPSEDVRSFCTDVISSTTKISKNEASELMEGYEFTKNNASSLINVSKEFVNTYLQTNRKLPLGGRATSNVALSLKTVEKGERTYPKKVGVDADGKGIYQNTPTTIPAHTSVRVHGQCPDWVK